MTEAQLRKILRTGFEANKSTASVVLELEKRGVRTSLTACVRFLRRLYNPRGDNL